MLQFFYYPSCPDSMQFLCNFNAFEGSHFPDVYPGIVNTTLQRQLLAITEYYYNGMRIGSESFRISYIIKIKLTMILK
jgi:hypothetical protein